MKNTKLRYVVQRKYGWNPFEKWIDVCEPQSYDHCENLVKFLKGLRGIEKKDRFRISKTSR